MKRCLLLAAGAVAIAAGSAAAAPKPRDVPRTLHTATALADGRVLVVGGFREQPFGTLDRVDLYDPATKKWKRAAHLAHGRKDHTATLLADGRVMVIGGGSWDHATQAWSQPPPEIFDPAANTWTAAAPITVELTDHSATLLSDGRVMVVGGVFGTGASTLDAQIYDPASDTWTSGGAPAVPRILHAAVALPGGGVAIFGGSIDPDFRATDAVDVWDPRTSTWTTLMHLATPRASATATRLPDGRVLVAGGSDQAGFIATAEVCDVSSGHCAAAGSLATGRCDHEAVLLPSGEVAIVGGEAGSVSQPHQVAETEIFDPATFSWRTGTALKRARHEHTATALPGGDILVTGGAGCGVACERTIGSIERFAP